MLTPTRASMTKTMAARMMPMALSTGDHMDEAARTLLKMANPISTMPEGDRALVKPVALLPTWRSPSMMLLAKLGPLVSSHQKKPVKIVNLTNSAKNSPMSALRKAIMPKVQTIEITTRVQNSQVAALVIADAHALAAVEYRASTESSKPALSIAAWASSDRNASPKTRNGVAVLIFAIFSGLQFSAFSSGMCSGSAGALLQPVSKATKRAAKVR